MSTSNAMKQQANRASEPMSHFIAPKQQRADVQAMVSNAAQCIAPVWPLETFIACNPLQGFESQPFDTALAEAQFLFESHSLAYQSINRETIKWCATYFDEGQRVIDMPVGDRSFYPAWRKTSDFRPGM